MRISIVLGPFYPVPPVLGGAVEKVHLLLADAYRAAGHEVTIVSRRYKDFPHREVVDGVTHIRVRSFDRSSSLPANLVLDFCYALRVAAALPPSDVTVTNAQFLPLVLARRTAGKIYAQLGRYPKRQMFLYLRADRIQAVSNELADAIAWQTPWLARKVRVIAYAISDAYFGPPSLAERDKTVLFVGRIAREKGIELLIRAFLSLAASMPDVQGGWRLRVVGPHELVQGGDGVAYLDELKQLARPLGSRCEFIGPVFDQNALIAEYQAASIFVYPSLAATGEALPVAPLEAMAAACATIVSDLRCFRDYIQPAVTGLTFDHRSANSAVGLATQLATLMGDPSLLRSIAQAGHRAARRFGTAAIAARMLDDFASLLERQPQ
jgi:glycosyltransferase involved in cell wall biosynthesis